MTFDPNNPDDNFDPFKELFGEEFVEAAETSEEAPDAAPATPEPSAPSEPSAPAENTSQPFVPGQAFSDLPTTPPASDTTFNEDLPTEAMSSADVAKVQWDLPETQATPSAESLPPTMHAQAAQAADASATPAQAPQAQRAPVVETSASAEEPPSFFWQKMTPLVWVAVVVALILAMAVGYIAGNRVGALQAIPDEPEPTFTPPPLPEDQPVPPGTYAWNELHGGECISFYASAWQEEFVVIDCSIPHQAQLIRADSLSSSSFWPETAAYERELPNLCQDPQYLDLSIAENYTDIQLSYSYPTSQAQYRDVEDRYFCFISRATGEALTESVMPAPIIEDEPEASADPNA